MLTNMAFSAFFYGSEPGNAGQTFVAGFISAAVMIPVSNVFPSIFAFTNTFRSNTVLPLAERKRLEAEAAARGTCELAGSGGGYVFWSLLLGRCLCACSVLGEGLEGAVCVAASCVF
jgi:hypothetical protein